MNNLLLCALLLYSLQSLAMFIRFSNDGFRRKNALISAPLVTISTYVIFVIATLFQPRSFFKTLSALTYKFPLVTVIVSEAILETSAKVKAGAGSTISEEDMEKGEERAELILAQFRSLNFKKLSKELQGMI